MTHPFPKGENLRKAVKWISDKRKADSCQDPGVLAEKASIYFDLSPEDSEFLARFVRESDTKI